MLRQYTLFLVVSAFFFQCESDSCENEPPKAKVESNSAGISSSRVSVTLNHQESGQSFQLTDITEDNPKRTGSLPSGEYYINATVSKSTGSYNIRSQVEFKECIDYKVFVNATNLSIYINGKAR